MANGVSNLIAKWRAAPMSTKIIIAIAAAGLIVAGIQLYVSWKANHSATTTTTTGGDSSGGSSGGSSSGGSSSGGDSGGSSSGGSSSGGSSNLGPTGLDQQGTPNFQIMPAQQQSGGNDGQIFYLAGTPLPAVGGAVTSDIRPLPAQHPSAGRGANAFADHAHVPGAA